MSLRIIVMVGAHLFFAATIAWADEIHWFHSYDDAWQKVEETGRPLLIDFGTAGCHWCRQLDATTFRDPDVVKLLAENFVAVKIDAGEDPWLARALKISAYPTLLFAASDGTVLEKNQGYVDAARFRRQLLKALKGRR